MSEEVMRQSVRANAKRTKKIVTMGMMVAISITLVYFIHFPIIPVVPFLEYDPADIPILVGTFAFGPLAGVVLTVITALVQGMTVSAASGLYGILMHIIATSAFVIVAGCMYQSKKTKKMAVISLIAGMAVMAFIMVPSNMVITPAFMGVPRDTVWNLMPFIVGFNIIKAGINGFVTFYVYKRISAFLHR